MTLALPESAAQNPEFNGDPWEVRLPQGAWTPSDDAQRAFRDGSVWHQTEAAQAGWRVQAHENRVVPARMYGPGLVLPGDSPESRALAAWDWALGSFGFLGDDLGEVRVARGSKHDRVFATQELDGPSRLGGQASGQIPGRPPRDGGLRLVAQPSAGPGRSSLDASLCAASVAGRHGRGRGETWAPPT